MPTREKDSAEAQQNDGTQDALVHRESAVVASLRHLKLFLSFLFLLCPIDPVQSR